MSINHEIILAPSILAGDHANLKSTLRIIEKAGLKWVHLDIMDGHFVPNLTFGPQTVKAIRSHTDLFFDVHLMLENPDLFVEAFVGAGAQQITIHIEPNYPVEATLKQIKSCGCKCGIALNPGTKAEAAEPFLELCDIILLMTVQPGFGGQKFREDVLPKMNLLSYWRKERGLEYRLEVDGGINLQTAKFCTSRNIDTLVAGTAFFKAKDPIAFAKSIATV